MWNCIYNPWHSNDHYFLSSTSLTTMLSSQVPSSPRPLRIDLTCSRAKRSLGGDKAYMHFTIKCKHINITHWGNSWQKVYSMGQVFTLNDDSHICSCSLTCKHTLDLSYLSICDRYLVWKISGVFKASVTCPLNSKPFMVKSNRTPRTISPKYIPLVSFSNLQTHRDTWPVWDPHRSMRYIHVNWSMPVNM